MTTIPNNKSCAGQGCDRKDGCLRYLVLSGNVPCFPIAEALCYWSSDKVFEDHFVAATH